MPQQVCFRHCESCQLWFPIDLAPVCPRCGERVRRSMVVGKSPFSQEEFNALEVEHQFDAFKEEVLNWTASRDFTRIADCILEHAYYADQDTDDTSSPHIRWLAGNIWRFLAARYELPANLKYDVPFRDKYLSPLLREDWDAFYYHQLIITCILLGKKKLCLASPYNLLREFYQLMAEKQAEAIEAAVQHFQRKLQ